MGFVIRTNAPVLLRDLIHLIAASNSSNKKKRGLKSIFFPAKPIFLHLFSSAAKVNSF